MDPTLLERASEAIIAIERHLGELVQLVREKYAKPAPKPRKQLPKEQLTDWKFFTKESDEEMWVLPVSVYESLCKVFGRDAVEKELALAKLWLETKVANRKTSRGMPDFLRRWMVKANDRGRLGGGNGEVFMPKGK